jgi:hypothetical protein
MKQLGKRGNKNKIMKNKNTNARLGNIRRAAAFLRKALADCGADVSLDMTVCGGERNVKISFHRVENNFDATNILRSLNIGERAKSVFADSNPWHTLEGINSEITATVFAKGLPASCKLVEVVERIPKTNVVTQTVEGEFIEVKRLKTVCG